MAIRLTLIQRCNIHDLEWNHGVRTSFTLGFAGFDARMRPTIYVKGAHGEKLIAWARNGVGRHPKLPLRDLTEEELDELDPEDSELLYGLPYMVAEFSEGIRVGIE